LETDFVQTLPHVFRSDDGQLHPPLQGRTAENSGFFIELSRYDGERTPVHVYYRCENNLLNMSLEPVIGRPRVVESATNPIPVYSLLQNIEHCEATFLGADNVWRSAWPGDQSTLKPRAIRIRLTLDGRGEFERIYYLP
jgi:hypothetical protein